MVTEQAGDENFDIFKSVTGLSAYRIMDIYEVKIKYSLFFRINKCTLDQLPIKKSYYIKFYFPIDFLK